MRHVSACPGCGGGKVSAFFAWAGVPVHVGVQWESRAAALDCPRGEIRLAFCRGCGLIFNDAFDERLLRYAEGYDNALDFSPTFAAYAKGLAERLVERYGIRGKAVIEIGCGDGAFLRQVCAAGGNRGFGFDPGHRPREVDAGEPEADVRIVADRFTAGSVQARADLVCCRHVLEHIGRPGALLAEVRTHLAGRREAVTYFEVPDSESVIRTPYPWLIIYEHCLYFTAASLARLFTACGFEALRAGRAFGGQYAFVEARYRESKQPGEAISDEAFRALAGATENFAERCRQLSATWRDRLDRSYMAGERVALWGGGARAVSFARALGLTHERVPCVVDLNPRKWGRYLSGTGQEIVPPEFLREYRPDVVIIMNEIYRPEIEERLGALNVKARCVCL